jgi:hypothetical protein
MATLAVLGAMWFLDTLIKRSQGQLPSQVRRGFEVKNLNPVKHERSAGTETNKCDD